jgi:hypothetical protein
MTLLIRLLPVQRCAGCGDVTRRVESRTLLCLPCFDPWLKTQERKAKLDSTLSFRFAWPMEKITEFRELFQSGH